MTINIIETNALKYYEEVFNLKSRIISICRRITPTKLTTISLTKIRKNRSITRRKPSGKMMIPEEAKKEILNGIEM